MSDNPQNPYGRTDGTDPYVPAKPSDSTSYGSDSTSYGSDSTSYGSSAPYGSASTGNDSTSYDTTSYDSTSYGTDSTSYGSGSSTAGGAYGSSYAPADSTQSGQYGQYGQQPAYAQGYNQGQGYGAPTPQGPAPSRALPITLIVLGFLTMILAPIIGLMMSAAATIGSLGETDLSQFQQVSSGSSVSLPANTPYSLVDDGAAVADSGTTLPADSCQVTDPAGSPVSLTSAANTTFQLGPEFTTGAEGDYTITCSDPGAQTVQLMPADFASDTMSAFGENAGGMIWPTAIGFILSLLGLIAGIIGIVMLVRVNRRRRAMGY